MKIDEYKSALQAMDWWYDFSDDHRVWRAGLYRKQFLERVSNESPEHRAAWDETQKQLRDGKFRRRGRLWRKEEV